MYEYKCKMREVTDGDTIKLQVDLGFTVSVNIVLRLARIDAAEVKLYKNVTQEEKTRGIEAKHKVTEMLSKAQSLIVNTTERGKFGRWVGELIVDGVNLSDWLVKNKYAEYVEY